MARYVANATAGVEICHAPSSPVGTVASDSQLVAPPARRRWTRTWWAAPGRTWPHTTLARKSNQIGLSKWASAGFGVPSASCRPDCQPVYLRPPATGSSCQRYCANSMTRGSRQAM